MGERAWDEDEDDLPNDDAAFDDEEDEDDDDDEDEDEDDDDVEELDFPTFGDEDDEE